jgi:hypothetical protein
MRITDKELNQIIARNLLDLLGQAQLREQHLSEIARITLEETHVLLAGGGASLGTLYHVTCALGCAFDDLFLGLYDAQAKYRSPSHTRSDRLGMLHALRRHEGWKRLGEPEHSQLRDSFDRIFTGLAGLLRFLE